MKHCYRHAAPISSKTDRESNKNMNYCYYLLLSASI